MCVWADARMRIGMSQALCGYHHSSLMGNRPLPNLMGMAACAWQLDTTGQMHSYCPWAWGRAAQGRGPPRPGPLLFACMCTCQTWTRPAPCGLWCVCAFGLCLVCLCHCLNSGISESDAEQRPAHQRTTCAFHASSVCHLSASPSFLHSLRVACRDFVFAAA